MLSIDSNTVMHNPANNQRHGLKRTHIPSRTHVYMHAHVYTHARSCHYGRTERASIKIPTALEESDDGTAQVG
jgi:hypothetical protein